VVNSAGGRHRRAPFICAAPVSTVSRSVSTGPQAVSTGLEPVDRRRDPVDGRTASVDNAEGRRRPPAQGPRNAVHQRSDQHRPAQIGTPRLPQAGENSGDPGGKAGGQPAENLRTIRGWLGDRLGTTAGRHGDEFVDCLGNPWGRHVDEFGSRPTRYEQASIRRANLRRTRGQPGEDMRTQCGDDFVVLRRRSPIHARCTPTVDRNSRSHLGKRGMSTLSTAPMTSTTSVIYPRKNSTQTRAWGSTDPSPPTELFHLTPSPKPAGGGST